MRTATLLLSLGLALLASAQQHHEKATFDRSSVESPPDVIPDAASPLEAIKHKMRRLPYSAAADAGSSGGGGPDAEFSRGAVESGSRQRTPNRQPDYYGAAAYIKTTPTKFHPADSGFYPARESVEGVPKAKEVGYYPAREAVEGVPPRTKSNFYIRNRAGAGSEFTGSNLKVVCYFSSWAAQRPAPMNFEPSDIDAHKCSHVIYAFAGIDQNQVRSLNESLDITQGSYKSIVGLKRKNPDLKVLISVGGWREGGKKFSDMASSNETRSKFVESAVAFLKKHEFDGLDLDWEFPGESSRDGKKEDKDNFAALVDDLHAAFSPNKFLLSAALSGVKSIIDDAYDVPRISKKLDLMNVMAYFFRGYSNKTVDHLSPLHARETDVGTAAELNAEFALQYWEKLGAPKEKLLLGVPFHGSSFTLGNPSQTSIGSPSSGPGEAGPFTKELGSLAYYEICDAIIQGSWAVSEDMAGNVYAYKGDKWVGFDSAKSIAQKMEYVRTNGLGGAMVWAVDLDDFRGKCGEKSPLLNTMSRILRPFATSGTDGIKIPAAVVVDDEKDDITIVAVEDPSLLPPPVVLPPPGQPGQPGQPSQPSQPGQPGSAFSCMGKPAGNHPSPTSCNEFYTCTPDGMQHVTPCPEGLHYDKTSGSCNWPDQANCKIANARAGTGVNRCRTVDDGLYSDPADCQKMFWCANQVQYSLACPYGQFFDSSRGTCHFYASVRCPSGVMAKVGGITQAPVLQTYLLPQSYYQPSLLPQSNINPYQPYQQQPAANNKNVICYFSNWANHRSGDGRFVPENIDAALCSHVFYAFANLDSEKLEIVVTDPRTDIDNAFFNRVETVSKSKNKDVKVILAIGGWADSGTNSYSKLVNSAENRTNFIAKTVQFLKTHKFDGISLDWQYPVCWQADCRRGPASDKEGFTELVKELKQALAKDNLILAASLSGHAAINGKAYDLPELGKYLDLVSVMTYDYHGFWDDKTGHHSPLHNVPGTEQQFLEYNAESALAYIAKNGIPKQNIHVGIPLYGQSFELSTSANGLGATTRGKGKAGEFTLQSGMLSYYEICRAVTKSQWTKSPGTADRGPYAYSKDQWVGYDDVDTVELKAKFVVDQGYGGATLWTIDFDDFNNLCCEGPNPLLNAASRVLRGFGSPTKPGDCARPAPPVTPSPVVFTTPFSDNGAEGSVPVGPSVTTVSPAAPAPTTPAPANPVSPAIEKPVEPVTAGEDCVTGATFPHPSDCTKYVQCVQGKKIEATCPGGLYWHKEGQRCDWKDNVVCSTSPSLKSSLNNDGDDSDDLLVIESGNQQQQAKKESCPTGQNKAVAGDCKSFTACVDGVARKQSCASGLHWASAKGFCDWPENSDCKAQVRVSEGEDCQESSFKRDDKICGVYYQCVHGKYVKFQCAGGLFFNNGVCDFPQNVDCKNKEAVISDNDPASEPTATTPASQPATTTLATTATTTLPPPSPTGWPAQHDFKIVCYFTNWAVYRPEGGKYKAEDIDANLCTHIVYGFATLDPQNLVIKAHDPWADYEDYGYKFYEKVTEFKKRGIKVTLAIGGWNDSEGDKYSRLVNNPAARAKFVEHVVKYLLDNKFDGLDLDWEYPACWQTECKEDRKPDKEGFSLWVQELRAALDPHKLLLSAAVSPSAKIVDLGYDVPILSKNLDWIAIMTYDFHGHWDKKTGHVAPMYEHPDDTDKTFNTNYTIDHWLNRGADKKKLILGMPLYGQAFTLDSAANNSLNALAGNKGMEGQFTKQAGFLAYYEICDKVKNEGYKVVQDTEGRMGPYAYKDSQWVSYDDVAMLKFKSEYIRKLGLGGGMVWALDLDDFNNRCGNGKYPLLSTIKSVLGPAANKYPGVTDGSGQSSRKGSPAQEKPAGSNEVGAANDSNDEKYKVVCYFTNWSRYRPGIGTYTPSNIDESLCTHIVYGFAVLDPITLKMKSHDPWADIDSKSYESVVALKGDEKKKRKILLALGGWNDSEGDKYSRLVTSQSSRKEFITDAVAFLKKYNFDGLDLDWEYPRCWQVDCKKGPESDKANFALWIKELKEAFAPNGLMLTAAVSPSKAVVDDGYDVPSLATYLDYVSIMTYDYHGQWDKKTGHVAPMYHHPLNTNEFFNVNYTVNYWLQKGLSKNKIIVGMPMYGQSFSLADATSNGLGSKSVGGGTPGTFTAAAGMLAYYEICDLVKNKGWKLVRDPESRMGPYAFKGTDWVGFDDIDMIREKTQYVKEMGLGGAMIWALDLDDFGNSCKCESYPLLKTINRGLGRLDSKDPKCDLKGVFRIQDVLNDYVAEVTTAPSSKCDGGSFKPSEEDCRKYFVCDQGNYLARECPAGLVWDRKSACDWPANVDCKLSSNVIGDAGEITATTEKTTTAKLPTQPVEAEGSPQAPSPPAQTPVAPADVPDTGFKVVCYFTNWAWYRPGHGKYTPDHVDPALCTHINYGFAVLDSSTLLLKPHDTWADLDEYGGGFYKKIVTLKAKGVKVLIALGGWNDSEGDKYSRLVNNPQARAAFIQHALEFIEMHGFDGLDLDWEYPKCWQVDCDKGPESDRANFALFVEELSKALKPKKLLLTAAVSPSKMVIDAGYDVPKLNQYLDIINVMTYDYHGHWDKKTGHVAPLKDYEGSEVDYFNAEFTLKYWVEKGADPKKLVMGIPMYGQAFTLASPQETGLNAAAPNKGVQGEFTRAAGFIAYYEICPKVKEAWTVVYHDREAMGPYIFKGDQWVGYDDIAMVRRKSEFIKANGYGGGMIWALDLDDFSNVCGCEEYPLLRTINRVLRNYPLPDPKCDAKTYVAQGSFTPYSLKPQQQQNPYYPFLPQQSPNYSYTTQYHHQQQNPNHAPVQATQYQQSADPNLVQYSNLRHYGTAGNYYYNVLLK